MQGENGQERTLHGGNQKANTEPTPQWGWRQTRLREELEQRSGGGLAPAPPPARLKVA